MSLELQQALLANFNDPKLKSIRLALEAAMPFGRAYELFFSSMHVDDEIAFIIAGILPLCPSVRWLYLSYNEITPVGAEYIANALPMMHSLDTLCIAGNPIGKSLVKIVRNLPRYVTQVDFRECGIGKDDLVEIFEVLSRSKDIISIDISGNNIGNEGIEIVSHYLVRFKKLLYFHCANCGLSRAGLTGLCERLCELPELKALDISGNDVESAYPSIVDILSRIKRLSFLGLKDGRLTTASFTALFNKINSFVNLKRILISGNRINESAIVSNDTAGQFILDDEQDLCPDGE